MHAERKTAVRDLVAVLPFLFCSTARG